jgi:hypothetical protein
MFCERRGAEGAGEAFRCAVLQWHCTERCHLCFMNIDHKTAESGDICKGSLLPSLSRLFCRTIAWLKVRVERNFCLRPQRCSAWQKAVLRLVLCFVGISDFFKDQIYFMTPRKTWRCFQCLERDAVNMGDEEALWKAVTLGPQGCVNLESKHACILTRIHIKFRTCWQQMEKLCVRSDWPNDGRDWLWLFSRSSQYSREHAH